MVVIVLGRYLSLSEIPGYSYLIKKIVNVYCILLFRLLFCTLQSTFFSF